MASVIAARKCGTRGPTRAAILIIGEAPGANEEAQGVPFVGASGAELNHLLIEAGLSAYAIRLANVCNYRPPNNEIAEWISSRKTPPSPDWLIHEGKWVHPLIYEGLLELSNTIIATAPKLILALGNIAMWALTHKWGITAWRGSELWNPRFEVAVVPTFHPAALFRQYEWRPLVVQDLKRARGILEGKPVCRQEAIFPAGIPYLSGLLTALADGPKQLAVDIETRKGSIACLGIGESANIAYCIPFMKNGLGSAVHYWSYEDEWTIRGLLREILSHPNARVVGHNFSYDIQYIGRELGVWPKVYFDTIVAQHVLFAGMQKSLAFIASMYADYYVYWKEDGKYWDEKQDEKTLWEYNCLDCIYTYEMADKLKPILAQAQLVDVFDFQMNKLYPAVNKMALRGFKVNKFAKYAMASKLLSTTVSGQDKLDYIVGKPLNIRSPKQMQDLFYGEFGFKPRTSRISGAVTMNDEALESIAKEEIIMRPLVGLIQGLRSANVFLSNFLSAKLDDDGRMRSSFSIVGTTTYRFASSENPYGTGLNMQNLPLREEEVYPGIILPNIRDLFIADPNRVICDVDLQSADAQIVAAEAGDEQLLEAYSKELDVHLMNANDIWGLRLSGNDFVEGTSDHSIAKTLHAKERRGAKAGVHATNYGASAKRLAQALGISILEAQEFQTAWFLKHPGIKEWQKRVEESLHQTRMVYNAFGYRRVFLGRLDAVLPEALAWGPQSTVACIINRALVNLDNLVFYREPDAFGNTWHPVELLVQVHDSLVFQIDLNRTTPEVLKPLFAVPVPTKTPVTIGVGCSIGPTWGSVKPYKW